MEDIGVLLIENGYVIDPASGLEGKMDVLEFLSADAVTEILRDFLSVSFGNVQNHTGLKILLFGIQKKIVYGSMVLCQNAGTHCGVTDKSLHLFRGKVPESVDLLSLKNAGGNIVAYCPVGQAGG